MKKIAFIGCIWAFLIGCQNDASVVSQEDRINLNADFYTVGEQYAIAAARGFVNSLISSTRSGEQKEIGDVYAWLSRDLYPETRGNGEYPHLPDTMLYIVNFQNEKGFVLVHSQDSMGRILAYVEQGNLSPSDSIGDEGFRFFLKSLRQSFPPEPIEPFPNDSNVVGPDPIFPGSGEFELPWEIDSIIPPLLATRWGQHAPFNYFCFTSSGEQAVAGCVPVSIAKIAAFHRSPSSYNGHIYDWDEILTSTVPTSSIGRESVAHLVHDIGVIAGTTYGNESVGSSTNANMKGPTLIQLGYHYLYDYYDYDLCMQEFQVGRPVLFGGHINRPEANYPGHSWVVDGGIIRGKHITVIDNTGHSYQQTLATQKLIHCNWGWDGKYNGYFVFDNLELRNRVLTDSLEIPNEAVQTNYNFNMWLDNYYEIYPVQQE